MAERRGTTSTPTNANTGPMGWMERCVMAVEYDKLIDEILEVVPESEAGLRGALASHRPSIVFAAPEAQGHHRHALVETLAVAHRDSGGAEWALRMRDVWNAAHGVSR